MQRNFETFKSELTNVLNAIINDHNLYKTRASECSATGDKIKEMEDKLKAADQLVDRKNKMRNTNKVPEKQKTYANATKPNDTHINNDANKFEKKIAFIGDSVGSSVDFDLLEKETKAEITKKIIIWSQKG